MAAPDPADGRPARAERRRIGEQHDRDRTER
jgi:hypothetical protein